MVFQDYINILIDRLVLCGQNSKGYDFMKKNIMRIFSTLCIFSCVATPITQAYVYEQNNVGLNVTISEKDLDINIFNYGTCEDMEDIKMEIIDYGSNYMNVTDEELDIFLLI